MKITHIIAWAGTAAAGSVALGAPAGGAAGAAAAKAAEPAAVTKAADAAKDLAREALAAPVDTVARWTDKAVEFAVDKGPGVIGALTLLILGWMLSAWVRRMVRRGCERAHFDLTLSKFLANVAKWIVLAFVIITSLGTLGVSVTGFAAILGAAGLAVGLALQGNLSNLASGVLLLVFRPFKIGDSVIVAGQSGVVDGIDLFTTNLDTGDNRRVIVPNTAIFSGVIENQSHHPRRAISVNVPVGGGVPFDRAEAVLRGCVERVQREHPGTLSDPAPAVALAEINPGVIWTVTLWAKTPEVPGVRQALLKAIKQGVDEAGIAPPAPVQQVLLKQA
jgi:small conductance mechanosensitive channel